jgi:hypothetical protein
LHVQHLDNATLGVEILLCCLKALSDLGCKLLNAFDLLLIQYPSIESTSLI